MPQIAYATAWDRDDSTHAANAKAFWTGLGLLKPAAAEERVKELCSLAYANGQLVGVTTVVLDFHPPLNSRFAFYRCAVAPDFRRHYLATLLTRHTLTTMEAWSLENPQEEVQGIAAILQARELGSKAVHPQWADYNIHLNLVGFDPHGDQIRVAWFRHARLEGPGAPGFGPR